MSGERAAKMSGERAAKMRGEDGRRRWAPLLQELRVSDCGSLVSLPDALSELPALRELELTMGATARELRRFSCTLLRVWRVACSLWRVNL